MQGAIPSEERSVLDLSAVFPIGPRHLRGGGAALDGRIPSIAAGSAPGAGGAMMPQWRRASAQYHFAVTGIFGAGWARRARRNKSSAAYGA